MSVKFYILLGFNSWQGDGTFSPCHCVQTGSGAQIFSPCQHVQTSFGAQWVLGVLSLGIKQLEYEADHLPPSSAKVMNARSYTSTLPNIFTAWYLVYVQYMS
jgi:hypothetical protein